MMLKHALILLAVVQAAQAVRDMQPVMKFTEDALELHEDFGSGLDSLFAQWMEHHSKAYDTEEERSTRFENFRDNLKYIREHSKTKRSYTVGLNSMADLTFEEYQNGYLG